jgi:hypothetical protein
MKKEISTQHKIHTRIFYLFQSIHYSELVSWKSLSVSMNDLRDHIPPTIGHPREIHMTHPVPISTGNIQHGFDLILLDQNRKGLADLNGVG